MIKKSFISVLIMSLIVLLLGLYAGYKHQESIFENLNKNDKADSINESALNLNEENNNTLNQNNGINNSTLSDEIANSDNTESVDITPNNEVNNINEKAITENSETLIKINQSAKTPEVKNTVDTNKQNIENKELKEESVNKNTTAVNKNVNTNTNITTKPTVNTNATVNTNKDKNNSNSVTVSDKNEDTPNKVTIVESVNNNKTAEADVTESKPSAPTSSNVDIIIYNKNETPITIKDDTSTKNEVDSSSAHQIENLIFNLINKERSKLGRPNLIKSDTAAKYARKKSKDMYVRNYFEHKSPEGTLVYNDMLNDGIVFRSWAENLGYISSSKTNDEIASTLMNNWMNSYGHKVNILSSSYTHVGIGIHKANGEVYATQEFLSF